MTVDNLDTAINSVIGKNPADFKKAITAELARKLHSALDRARETVAASSLNRGVAEETVNEQSGSFAAYFKTKEDSTFATNDLRFRTEDEAKAYGRDLFRRWLGASEWKVMPHTDKPNHEIVNNVLKRIGESVETEGDDIQERVEIDGRTRAYKSTVARIEQLRKSRAPMKTEEGGDKYAGLYDDGSGKGASVPAPLDINPARFQHITGVNEQTVRESEKQEEYQRFFKKALKKFGANSPADLKGDKKKQFFDYVDKNWKSEEE